MPRPSRLSLAKDDVLGLFADIPEKVYSKTQLAKIFAQNRSHWHLTKSTTAADFLSFLIKYGSLRACQVRSEAYGQEITRYSWGRASPYELALSLRPHSYLSHGTAAVLHGLGMLSNKTIYVNAEQTPKPSYGGELSQGSINRAFAGKQRESNLSYKYGRFSIVQLSGKNTKRLGVEDIRGPNSESLVATNLERTLIDIVVRPTYTSGPSQVLKAYRDAKERVSVERLFTTLKKLDHTYPYHQAIGFLMQRAGYAAEAYRPLHDLGLEFDFHLTHGAKNAKFSEEWRLFYPDDLEGVGRAQLFSADRQ